MAPQEDTEVVKEILQRLITQLLQDESAQISDKDKFILRKIKEDSVGDFDYSFSITSSVRHQEGGSDYADLSYSMEEGFNLSTGGSTYTRETGSDSFSNYYYPPDSEPVYLETHLENWMNAFFMYADTEVHVSVVEE